MKMKTYKTEKVVKEPDLSVLKKEHEGKWVALSPDYTKILATGNSLEEIDKKSSGKNKVVMMVIPSGSYAPSDF